MAIEIIGDHLPVMAQGRRLFAPHCPIEAKTMDQDQRWGRCRIRTEQLAGGAIGRLGDVTA